MSAGSVSTASVGVARLRLGTRRSALATAQSVWVAERLRSLRSVPGAAPGEDLAVELVEVTTEGDVRSAPLAAIGGTGVFVSALREAILAGEVDLAVHSLKDLPTAAAPGVALAAVPTREDPRDVLIARDGLGLAQLPAGSVIGTGSPRRAAQLRALGLGLQVVAVRGNVDTRLRMVGEGRLDGVVLARAGLLRLGRQDEVSETLDPLVMLPAPGQGALAVECRSGDPALIDLLGALDDPATRLSVTAERALLAALEAGCSAPVGALAEVVDGEDSPELSLRAVVVAPDGSDALRRSATVPLSRSFCEDGAPQAIAAADALGRALGSELLTDGAAGLMPPPGAAARPAHAMTSDSGEGNR
jgi:hydroxymethylbilane synthase